MTTHRSLNFETFVSAISHDVLERYLGHFPWDTKPGGWQLLNPEALDEFINRSENAEFKDVVLEEFRRINDICARNMNLVVAAYNKFGLKRPDKRSAQELAMRLFVENRDAFEYAWTRYLLYAGAPKLEVHLLQTRGLKITEDKVACLEVGLGKFFSDDAKGTCSIRRFDDAGETIILITRGSYMRTVACWQGDNVAFTTFRPASEDVLVYDHATSKLSMKASLAKDRDRYLRAFVSDVVGKPELVEAASTGQVFSLAPIQSDTFDFAGDGVITRIDLVKVRLKLDGIEEPEIEIKSGDVRRTVERYLKASLASGTLTYARFRFHLRPEEEPEAKVTFEIEPPSRTDLAQKKYANIIERYLEEQQVKLA